MTDYHINIFFSEEDEGYIADVPDLPMCSAFGKVCLCEEELIQSSSPKIGHKRPKIMKSAAN